MTIKTVLLAPMSFLYVAAGFHHFWHRYTYLKIMPPWLPYPELLVYASGVLEMAFGLLLWPRGTRVAAAWCIIVLLIAVFPANIQMALNYKQLHHPNLWLAAVRLPLQFVLVWWAYIYTK